MSGLLVKRRTLIDDRTRLCDIPQLWLQIVEPRLVRQGTCWLWQGALDEGGHPVLSLIPQGKVKRSTKRVARIIADMFWELRPYHDVVHACGTLNCLNPNHFYVSAAHWATEDRPGIIAKRSTRIARWNKDQE